LIDLRIIRDRWTEEGAREIFAQLVTHCVRSTEPNAEGVRPDPGDEGLDTFVGAFDGDLKVWQSKYFCDGIGNSQKAQIRNSWRACVESPRFSNVVAWTLCLPIDLSPDEHSWWQKWKAKESAKHGVSIELWAGTRFKGFSAVPSLVPVFNQALSRGVDHVSVDEVVAGMRGASPPLIVSLPSADHLRSALFVRKLELAGWIKHRSDRTAFYNFELLRTAIEQGGTVGEQAALTDLREKVFSLWEYAYNEHSPGRLGVPLVAEVGRRIRAEHEASLMCALAAGEMHKLGVIHDWADHCAAGWTADYEHILLAETGA
jgi:hypothetical protein